jgi:hypothetical protein
MEKTNMTIKEFIFSPFYYIHACVEYLKASNRLSAVEKLSAEGKIPFSKHKKAFDEYMPYYEATWKYFTPTFYLLFTVMAGVFIAIAIR